MYDLIVIGAGPGGYEAAAHAGDMGRQTLLIEKNVLGGTCLNRGCIPTKTFLHASYLMHSARHGQSIGVAGTSTASIDMKSLQVRKGQVIEGLRKGVAGLMRKSKVTVVNASARVAAPGIVEANGEKFETRNILVATGSVTARPPIPGIDSPGVIDSTGALDLDTVPSSMAIIGGGVIGCELACFFAEAGCSVVIIEMLPALVAGLDSSISAALRSSLDKMGVKIHLSSKVMSIDNSSVSFADPSGTPSRVETQYVLNATGRMPAYDGLGLKEAGVDITRKGIRVDETGKTNIPGIWACGDVTGRCMLAHAAVREGIVAVNSMFGKKDRMRYDAVPWVVYTHPEAAGVGKTEEALKAEGVEYVSAKAPMNISGRYMIEDGSPAGMVKVLAGKKHREILGVHAVGKGCSEFIFGAAAMIEAQARVDDIRGIVFPHPTISEALKEAVVQLTE